MERNPILESNEYRNPVEHIYTFISHLYTFFIHIKLLVRLYSI